MHLLSSVIDDPTDLRLIDIQVMAGGIDALAATNYLLLEERPRTDSRVITQNALTHRGAFLEHAARSDDRGSNQSGPGSDFCAAADVDRPLHIDSVPRDTKVDSGVHPRTDLVSRHLESEQALSEKETRCLPKIGN